MNKFDVKRAKLALELQELHFMQAKLDAKTAARTNEYAVETNRIARDIAAVDLAEVEAECESFEVEDEE